MSMKKLLAALILAPTIAFAWQPTKPVTVLYGFGPGSGNEQSFRIASTQLERDGVNFKPQYHPGGGGNLVMPILQKAEPDGHTIAIPACQANWVLAEPWFPQVKFNINDFVLATHIAKSPLALFAHTSSSVDTPQQFAETIRKNQRSVKIALGATGHKLAVDYLLESLNVVGNNQVISAMYKGPAQAINDLLGNHTEFAVVPLAVGYPQVQSGRLKLIGIANEAPMKGLDAPLLNTIAPGLYIHGCWNIMLPPGTPSEIQQWYTENFRKHINSTEAQQKFAEQMMYSTTSWQDPEALKKAMYQMKKTWMPVAEKYKPQ
jgi:tripartite-type tricarboxylate transporter receptor subunit TctC